MDDELDLLKSSFYVIFITYQNLINKIYFFTNLILVIKNIIKKNINKIRDISGLRNLKVKNL